MNPSSRYRTEIILLAEASFEGTLDKEQAERLDQLVCEDPQAARLYVEYMELHGELHRMHRGQAPYSPDAPILGDVLGDATGNAFSDPLKEHKPPSGTGGMMFGWLGLGAITLITSLLAAMTLWWTYPLSDDRSNESLAVVNNSADNVAKLTAVSDCDWRTHGSAGTNVGARLIPGDRLALDRGSIEVTYDTGAKVRLEGPAVYVVSRDRKSVV